MNLFSTETERILAWFRENKRDLPWRGTGNPYHVWISEIMLQQTRVEAVKDYFLRFTKELPSVEALFEVEEEKLLKLWQGLGYYNRARNLKKAAEVMVKEYEKTLPDNYETLKTLPGIGDYTAGAIASIAYQQPVPAVDGNVLRVYMRYFAREDDISRDATKKQVQKELLEVIPKEAPGDYNQALMEIGALCCIPNGKPLCDSCPLQDTCSTNRLSCYDRIPVKVGKKARKIEKKTIFVICCGDKILLRKREDSGLLASMWEFPWEETFLSAGQAKNKIEENGIAVGELQLLGEKKHIFTHIEWHMIGYSVNISEDDKKKYVMEETMRWCTKQEIREEYAVPAAYGGFLEIALKMP